MIPYCKAHGMGLIPWSPLHQGDLARPVTESSARKEGTKGTPLSNSLTQTDEAIITRVEEIAKKKGWKMSEVALAWIDGKVTSPIVGCNSVREREIWEMCIFSFLSSSPARTSRGFHHSRKGFGRRRS